MAGSISGPFIDYKNIHYQREYTNIVSSSVIYDTIFSTGVAIFPVSIPILLSSYPFFYYSKKYEKENLEKFNI
jgi:hypothetical protein